MWQRFTDSARRVVFYAQEETAHLGGTEVTADHLLLGLLRAEGCLALRLLAALAVDVVRLKKTVENEIAGGESPGKEVKLSADGKRAIDLSYEEARQLANSYIGTEHLLLGIIRLEDGVASRALNALGADYRKVVAEIRALPGNAQSAKDKEVTASPWTRFTKSARRAVTFAEEEARRRGTGDVSMEHLLLGMIRDKEGIASHIFARLGVLPNLIQAELEEIIGKGEYLASGREMALTPESKRVIDQAFIESRQLEANYIGQEHLLLGLISARDSIASRVLDRLGVSYADVFKIAKAPYKDDPEVEIADVFLEAVGNFGEQTVQIVLLAEKERRRLQEEQISREHLARVLIQEDRELILRLLKETEEA